MNVDRGCKVADSKISGYLLSLFALQFKLIKSGYEEIVGRNYKITRDVPTYTLRGLHFNTNEKR